MASSTAAPLARRSCGNPAPHEIARRTTDDGFLVVAWSDGHLSGKLGLNVLTKKPLTPPQVAYVLDLAFCYGWRELGELIVEARAVA